MELAVFGSIFLMLLGILINYGLRYYYQQEAMQRAFRKALISGMEANDDEKPVDVQHLVVGDVHIPDPTNPFAVGSVAEVGGGASVTRNYQFNIPGSEADLPQMRIEINKNDVRNYTMASFIRLENVPEPAHKKYISIYGVGNIKEGQPYCEEYVGPGDPGWVRPDPMYDRGEQDCLRTILPLRIIDYCGGQIMPYDSCVSRCRQIVDPVVCTQVCNDEDSFEGEDCSNICSETIDVPWYCKDDNNNVPIPNDEHQYTFVKLNRLFNIQPGQSTKREMGLQAYDEETTMQNTLRKQETSSSITTTDNLNWVDTKTREVVYRDKHDYSGDVSYNRITSNVGRQKTTTWSTPH